LPALLAKLHPESVAVFWRFSSTPDQKNAKSVIAGMDRAGMGLPDRDYYLQDNPRMQGIREKYLAHMTNMLKLAGESADQAATDAKNNTAIETAMAKVALDRVSRRDPDKTYHKMAPAELRQLLPAIDWNRYFTAVAAPTFTEI